MHHTSTNNINFYTFIRLYNEYKLYIYIDNTSSTKYMVWNKKFIYKIMKIAEMQKICDKQQEKHSCCNCPLFTPLLKNGCLKNHRYEVSKNYQKAITSNNEVLAEKIMKDYQDLERKILKT